MASLFIHLGAAVAVAHALGCPVLLIPNLRATVTHDEILATGRVGRHVVERDGERREIFVNPGLPPDGRPTLSVERRYPTAKRARAVFEHLLLLHEARWPIVPIHGLTKRTLVIEFTEGPRADRPDLAEATDEFLDRVAGWALGRGLTVTRSAGQVHVRGRGKHHRLKFRLRPEHLVADLKRQRLLVNDLDPD